MRAPTPADAAERATVVVTRPGMMTVTGKVIYVQGDRGALPRRSTVRRDGGQVAERRRKPKTKVLLGTGNVIEVDPECVKVREEDE